MHFSTYTLTHGAVLLVIDRQLHWKKKCFLFPQTQKEILWVYRDVLWFPWQYRVQHFSRQNARTITFSLRYKSWQNLWNKYFSSQLYAI